MENDAASDGMLWKHTATPHSHTRTHIYTDTFLYIGALLHTAYTFCYILDAWMELMPAQCHFPLSSFVVFYYVRGESLQPPQSLQWKFTDSEWTVEKPRL